MLLEMKKDFIYNMKKYCLSMITLIATLIFSMHNAFADSNPFFVTITASEYCSTCKKLEPVVEELENEYSSKVTFITLDVSSKDLLETSRVIARENGVEQFFEENTGLVPKVGILCPGATKVEKIFIGETRKEIYKEAIEKLLTDTSTVCSL